MSRPKVLLLGDDSEFRRMIDTFADVVYYKDRDSMMTAKIRKKKKEKVPDEYDLERVEKSRLKRERRNRKRLLNGKH